MNDVEMRKEWAKKLWPEYCQMFHCRKLGTKCSLCSISIDTEDEFDALCGVRNWEDFLPGDVTKDYIPLERSGGCLSIAQIVSLPSKDYKHYFSHFAEKYDELRLKSFTDNVLRMTYPNEKLPVADFEEAIRVTEEDYRENSNNIHLSPADLKSLNEMFANEFRTLIEKCQIFYRFKFDQKADDNISALAEITEGRIKLILALDEKYRQKFISSAEWRKEKELWNKEIDEREIKNLKQAEELNDILAIKYGIRFKKGEILSDKDIIKSREKTIDEMVKKARSDIGKSELLNKIFADIGFQEIWLKIEDKILGPYGIRNSVISKKKCCYSSDFFFEKLVNELKKYQ